MRGCNSHPSLREYLIYMPWTEERHATHTTLRNTESGHQILIDGTGKIWQMHDTPPKSGYISGRRTLVGALESGELDSLVAFGIEHCENVVNTIDNLLGLQREREGEALPKKYARFAGVIIKIDKVNIEESNPGSQYSNQYSSNRSQIVVETEDQKIADLLRGHIGRLKHDLELTTAGKLVKFPQTNLTMIETDYHGRTTIKFTSSGKMTILGDAHLAPPPPEGISDENPEGPRILDLSLYPI